MLFKDYNDVKTHAGFIITGGHLDPIRQDILLAEDTLVRKYVGKAQFDALQAYFDANDPLDEEDEKTKLIRAIQPVIAHMALASAAPKINVQYSKQGIQSAKSEGYVPAREWMLDKSIDQMLEDGAHWLDKLLRFLNDNSDDYTLWSEDDSVNTQSKSHFVNHLDQLQEHFSLNDSFMTFKALRPAMRFIEDNHIKNAIGADFYDELKTAIQEETVTNFQQTIIRDYLIPISVFLTVERAVDVLPVQFRSEGIYINEIRSTVDTASQLTKPEENIRGRLKTRLRKDADTYHASLISYLNNNADNYPTWQGSDLFEDPDEEVETTNVNQELKGLYRF